MAKASWKDLEIYGRRNNKIIKYMETLLFKTKKDDPDTIVHHATGIANMTRQNIELIKLKENFDEILAWFSVIKKDEVAVTKLNIREMEKENLEHKRELQAEKDRAVKAGKTVKQNKKQHEIEEEKLVRRQAEKMKKSI